MSQSAENDAPRVRPVRPWQHWRFGLTVTLCWVARRHFLRFERGTASGLGYYRCRVCRSNVVGPARVIPPAPTVPDLIMAATLERIAERHGDRVIPPEVGQPS